MDYEGMIAVLAQGAKDAFERGDSDSYFNFERQIEALEQRRQDERR